MQNCKKNTYGVEIGSIIEYHEHKWSLGVLGL